MRAARPRTYSTYHGSTHYRSTYYGHTYQVLGTPSEEDLASIANAQAVQFLRTLPIKPKRCVCIYVERDLPPRLCLLRLYLLWLHLLWQAVERDIPQCLGTVPRPPGQDARL